MPIQRTTPDPTLAIYPTTYPKCPVCYANPGAFCRRENGRSGPFVAPHPDRTRAARDAANRLAARMPE